MPQPILLDPVHRALAANGHGDLALYGAPAHPDFSIRPIGPPADAVADASDGAAPPSASGGSLSPTSPAVLPASLSNHLGDAPALAHALQPIVLPAAAPAAIADQSIPASLTPIPLSQHAAAVADTPGQTEAPAQAEPPVTVLDGLEAPVIQLAPAGGLPLDAVGAQVGELLGSDPSAGIATLVSLVEVTDLLDLRDAGAEAAGGTVDAASALLDSLSADLIIVEAPADHPFDDADGDGGQAGGLDLPDLPTFTLPVDPPVDDLLHGL